MAHHADEKKASACSAAMTPITAHHESKPVAVNLTTCNSVSYEMRDQVPGVRYTKNGIEAWTPVVKRSRRKALKKQPDNSTVESTSDSSGSELDVTCSRMVQYSVREGVPGVSVHRRNVVWTPVVPSPVATRTRSRTKDNLN